MAQVDLTRIRITGFHQHYDLLMSQLQRTGLVQLTENADLSQQSTQSVKAPSLDLAKLEFAINFLTPFASPKSKLESLLSAGKILLSEKEASKRAEKTKPQATAIIEACQELEDILVRHQNELDQIPAQKQLLSTLSGWKGPLKTTEKTASTQTWIGEISTGLFLDLQQDIAQASNLLDLAKVGQLKKTTFIRLTAHSSLVEDINKILNAYEFQPLDLAQHFAELSEQTPEQIGLTLDRKAQQLEQDLQAAQVKAKDLAKDLDELKVLFDCQSSESVKASAKEKMFITKNCFAFEAWVVGNYQAKLERWIQNAFVGEVALEVIESSQEAPSPVLLQNKFGVASFQAITGMYGLPRVREFDPTPLLAPFFLIFFGLCLSDVGYGLILTLAASFFLVFGQFASSAKVTLRLLLYCGLAAMAGGVALGGYLGMTASQLPFLVDSSTGMFYGQFITPTEGSGPITFLLLSLGLGVVHLLFGMTIMLLQQLKNKDFSGAFFDTVPWLFMLTSLGLFAGGSFLELDPNLTQNLTIVGAIGLVLTQGRTQKNWLLKPLFGLLGLYNITNYLSDLLSYSRIMALGLATGVVGFAMNLTAGIFSEMMPHPVLGVAIATFVVLLGHFLNFSLSLLGAFIHSGRLQFIEFFGKFYEGGGEPFQPFVWQPRYLTIQEKK